MSAGLPEEIKGNSAIFSHYYDRASEESTEKTVGAPPKWGEKRLSLNSFLRKLG
jgi:hypothetical protein